MDYMIPLVASFLVDDWLAYWFYPVLGLSFIAFCFRLIPYMLHRR